MFSPNGLRVLTCGYTFTSKVGQNRTYTLCMTVYLVISLPNIPYVHRIYMVLANPIHKLTTNGTAMTIYHSDKYLGREALKQTERAQMYQCPNVPLSKCTKVPMSKCAYVQMYQFPNVPISKCPNVPMSKCTNVQMNQCTNVPLSKCAMCMYYEYVRFWPTLYACNPHLCYMPSTRE